MICVPIKKKSQKCLIKSLHEAQKIADIVEIWFDEINEKEGSKEQVNEKIFKLKKKPFIYKNTKEGNIENILQRGVQYIDIDISTPQKTIKNIREISPKTKIIMSFHDFKETPSDKKLREIAKKIDSKKVDIIKIATYANTFRDSLRMLKLLEELSGKSKKSICICMGKNGRITRAAGHLFGNYLMYAPIKKADKTADGQIEAKNLIEIQNLI